MKISAKKLLADVKKLPSKNRELQQYLTADAWGGSSLRKSPSSCNAYLQHPDTRNVILEFVGTHTIPDEYLKHILDMIDDLKDDTVTVDPKNLNQFKVSSIKTFRPYATMIVWRWIWRNPQTAMYAAYLKSQGMDTYAICCIIPFLPAFDTSITSMYWHWRNVLHITTYQNYLDAFDKKPQALYTFWNQFMDNDRHHREQIELQNEAMRGTNQTYRDLQLKFNDESPLNCAKRFAKDNPFSFKSVKKLFKEVAHV